VIGLRLPDRAIFLGEGLLELEWLDSLESVDWEELSELYRLAPLGNKNPRDLETVFSNSRLRCFVFESGVLIAAGRALADGADCSYICDVAVLPTHQGLGIGKAIVSRLIRLSKGHKKIILYTAPRNMSFYRKLGFRRMATAMAIFEDEAQAAELGLVDEAQPDA
jgi:ribosomal protein S18 acetylase RimI-like enzyme